MSKTVTITLSLCFFVLGVSLSIEAQDKAISTPVSAAAESSNRVQDGLNGPVRRVRLETAQILVKDGKSVEGPRELRGVTTYDLQGRKVDTVAYPLEGGSLTGKEQYRYDEKGNIIEMVARGDDGSVLSKETFRYEFDELGNWKKMITSVAVYENGTVSYEPIEVSYRTIAYYYGAVEKLEAGLKPDASPTTNRTATTSITKFATRDSGVVESIRPTGVTVGSPIIDNHAKDGAVKESSAPAETDRQSKRAADGLTLTNLAPALPNTASARNEKVSVKHGAEEKPKSAAINPSEQSEKISARVFSTESSGEHNEIKSSKRDETSSTTALYQTGITYIAAGAYDQAVETFNQLVRLNPNDAIAYAKLGLAYSGLRKYKEAIVGLNMAIRIKPEVVDAEGYYQLGYSYSQLGKHRDAVDAYKKALYATREEAIDNDQAGQRVPIWQIYYSLGLAYDNGLRYQDAIRELSEGVKLNPTFAEGYYALGRAYLARGDRSSAQKQQKILIPLNAALAKKLGEEVTASSFSQSLPCAGSIYFCR